MVIKKLHGPFRFHVCHKGEIEPRQHLFSQKKEKHPTEREKQIITWYMCLTYLLHQTVFPLEKEEL